MNKRVKDSALPELDNSTVNENDVKNLSGLVLFGTVSDRIKKSIVVSGSAKEVVTYTVETNDSHSYYVDDFAPESYYALGEKVIIPVYVKPYTKKTGVPGYMLKMQKDSSFSIRGERF